MTDNKVCPVNTLVVTSSQLVQFSVAKHLASGEDRTVLHDTLMYWLFECSCTGADISH